MESFGISANETASRPTQLSEKSRSYLMQRLDMLYLPLPNQPTTSRKAPKEALLLALTADANLAPGYRLDEESIALLAHLFEQGFELDPAAQMAQWFYRWAEPMYPDFPRQVLAMDEAEYRLHQMLHYASTYGVERFGATLGLKVSVRRGWMPPVSRTAKTVEDEVLLRARPVTLVTDLDRAADLAWQRILCRNERMADAESDLLCELPIPTDAARRSIPFHENVYLILGGLLTGTAIARPSDNFVEDARRLCQHPGDALKFITWFRYQHTHGWHYSTGQRKRLTRLLESFPAASFAENIARDRETALHALEQISYNRFSRSEEHRLSVARLRDGELPSWNSQKERAYASRDTATILAKLSERPGIMLREVVRLMGLGLGDEEILAAFGSAPKLSLATLLNLATRMSSPDFVAQSIGKRSALLAEYYEELENRLHSEPVETWLKGLESYETRSASLKTLPERYERMGGIARELLRRCIAQVELPFASKRVFVDCQDFDLAHSQVVTNVKSATKAVALPGMAFKVPDEAKVLRFFVFWDDRQTRVDLDLHAITDTGMHVGWNGAYAQGGMVMSGDVTTSVNSVEYLDVNLDEAREAGVRWVETSVKYYNGGTFDQIEEALCGVLVVGSTAPDVKLYQSGNALVRIALNNVDARSMHLCRIDVRDRCVISTLGGKVTPNARFSARDVLDMLFATHCVTEVGREEAEVVLCAGRAVHDDEISLFDNNWFLLG